MSTQVSIVIPTYKRPVLLKKCLEALILQDFQKEKYEIIIVTDVLSGLHPMELYARDELSLPLLFF